MAKEGEMLMTHDHEENNVCQLADIISDLLTSTIDADVNAAKRYYEVLEEYAFGEKLTKEVVLDDGSVSFVETGNRELSMVEFDLTDQSGNVNHVQMPKLSLMPLPLLHVTEATFDVALDMSISKEDLNNAISSEKRIKGGRDIRVSVLGDNNASKETSTKATNLKVSVKLGQSDMPGGVTSLLQLVSNSMKVTK